MSSQKKAKVTLVVTTEFVRRNTEALTGFIFDGFVCGALAVKQVLPVFLYYKGSDGYKFSIQLLRGLGIHPVKSAVFTLRGQ